MAASIALSCRTVNLSLCHFLSGVAMSDLDKIMGRGVFGCLGCLLVVPIVVLVALVALGLVSQ